MKGIRAFDVSTRAGQASRGLAFVLAGLNVSNGASDLGRLDGGRQTQVILDGLEGGAMAVEFAADALGKNSTMRLAGRTANLAGLVSAGFDISLYAGARESNKNERPLQDFLRDAGLSQKLAEELSNHDGRGRPVLPVLIEPAT